MSTLTNQAIKDTYPGLIKTTDNLGISATEKALEDGVGNTLPLTVGTTGISFNAGVDFSGATVTGLAAGGLVAGGQPDSMVSAAFLTPNPATATGGQSIVLGNAALANSESVGIGNLAQATASNSIAIGTNVTAGINGPAIAIGRFTTASGSVATAIGNGASVTADQSIGISGESLTISANRSVGIGRQANVASSNTVCIGNYAQTVGSQAANSIVLAASSVSPSSVGAADSLVLTPGAYGGRVATNNNRTISIGVCSSGKDFKCTGNDSIAIGTDAQSFAAGAVALGVGVVAGIANTTTVNELEVQEIGGGITMYSPDGTGYKVTIANGGTLTVTAI